MDSAFDDPFSAAASQNFSDYSVEMLLAANSTGNFSSSADAQSSSSVVGAFFQIVEPSPASIVTTEQSSQIQRSTAEVVEILIYSLCLCIGGPLNLLSFRRLISQLRRPISSISSRQFGSQLTLLKLHLNIADLITMFVYTLSQIIWMITYQWHAGDLLCRLIKFFHTFSFYLNSFIVACFAIDRFLGTRNLNNPSGGANVAQARVKRMLIFAWLWATLLSAPQFFIFRVFEPSELKNFKQCTPIWTILGYELDLKLGAMNESDLDGRQALIHQFEQVVAWERVYNMAHLLFLFWIPSLLIAASYAAILITLNSLSVPGSIKRNGVANFRRPSGQQLQGNGKENGSILSGQSNGNHHQNGNSAAHYYEGGGKEGEQRRMLNGNGNGTMENGNSFGGGRGSGGSAGGFIAGIATSILAAGGARRKKASNGSANGEMPAREWTLAMGGGETGGANANNANASGDGPTSPSSNKVIVGLLAAQTIAKARQNAKRQAALILAAYLTFWSPYNLLAIINAWAQKEGAIREISSASLPFLNSLIVVNPIVNPLIYGVFDDCSGGGGSGGGGGSISGISRGKLRKR